MSSYKRSRREKKSNSGGICLTAKEVGVAGLDVFTILGLVFDSRPLRRGSRVQMYGSSRDIVENDIGFPENLGMKLVYLTPRFRQF